MLRCKLAVQGCVAARGAVAVLAAFAVLGAGCTSGAKKVPPPTSAPPPEPEVGGLPTRPAGVLIDAALAAGTIDAKTAALYNALAHYAPERLPIDFQGVQQVFSTSDLSRLESHLPEYGPDEAAAARAMLASPGDPAWLVFPAAYGVHRFNGEARTGCFSSYGLQVGDPVRDYGESNNSCYFSFIPVLPVAPLLDPTRRLQAALDSSISAPWTGPAPISFKQYLDRVFELYLNQLGLADPRNLPVPSSNPPSPPDQAPCTGRKIPIYVLVCDGGNDAAASNKGVIVASLETPFEDDTLRRVMLPHEIFHLFEDAYQVPYVSDDFDWPYEASAVAVEDIVAPGLRRWSGRLMANTRNGRGSLNPMDRSFVCPEEPIHSNKRGPCDDRYGDPRAEDPYYGGYSKFVLIKYLMRNMENFSLASFWGAYKGANGNPTGLLTDEQVAEFQLALMADPFDKQYFDPDDRAAFSTPSGAGQTLTPDRETSDPLRYWYMENPAAPFTGTKFRFVPSEVTGAPGSLLQRLDTILPAGGTHRWLVWTGRRSDISLVLEPRSSQPVLWSVVALDSVPGTPPTPKRVTKNVAFMEDPLFPAIGTRALRLQGNAASLAHFESTGGDASAALVTITNVSNSPVAYRGGIECPSLGLDGCVDFYSGNACIDPPSGQLSSVCGALMHINAPPDRPYSPYDIDRGDPNCAGVPAPTELACANAGVPCATTPAAFVPLATWPNIPDSSGMCLAMACW